VLRDTRSPIRNCARLWIASIAFKSQSRVEIFLFGELDRSLHVARAPVAVWLVWPRKRDLQNRDEAV
jgi:hypothetical protein